MLQSALAEFATDISSVMGSFGDRLRDHIFSVLGPPAHEEVPGADVEAQAILQLSQLEEQSFAVGSFAAGARQFVWTLREWMTH